MVETRRRSDVRKITGKDIQVGWRYKFSGATDDLHIDIIGLVDVSL